MKKTKVAIYARTSTTDQSCNMQLKDCEEYCKNHGYDIYNEYVDVGWSGGKFERPEFNRLLIDMRMKRFDILIVWKLDRLSRSMQHFLNLFEEMKNKKIGFISVTQPIDTTNSAGRMQMQIIAVFSEFEREIIRERVKAGKRRSKIKQGRKPINVPVHKIKVLRKQGFSLRSIAKQIGVSYGKVFRVLQNTPHKNQQLVRR